MSAHYIIRLDDFAHNMNWANFLRASELLDRYGIKPLVGVIPQNEDPTLSRQPPVPVDFWNEIRQRQCSGWHIAMHGFRHCYDNNSSGILGITPHSEFAGHAFEEQLSRLQKAKKIFDQAAVKIETFMAPSHSFDLNTVAALKQIGIDKITDGFGLFPYEVDGMLFVPQLTERPFSLPLGVLTFCIHLNDIPDLLFERIESFIAKNHKQFIRFDQARDFARSHSVLNSLSRIVTKNLVSIKRWGGSKD